MRAFALTLLLVALAAPAAAAAPPDDGPGRYYVFRTLDSDNPATAEQNARCNAHFGARAPLAVVRLNARLFAFTVDPLTSRLAGQTASELGPGFICGTPGLSGDPFDAYAYTTLPGVGSSDASGSCALSPVTAQPGALFLGCRLAPKPDPSQGLTGGLVTSNSIVNPRNAVPGTPTGSVWTAYIVRTPGATSAPATPPVTSGPPPADVPGADLYVTRAFDDATPQPAGACPGTRATAARTATLRSVQPSLRTSEIEPGAEYTTVGALTVCYSTGATDRDATAQVRLGPTSSPLTLKASGRCRDLPSPAGTGFAQQNCVLNVASGPGGVRGGVITSNGLVRAGQPASAANSAVWTISLFGGKVSPSPANTRSSRAAARPRLRTTVKRRSRRTVTVRWRQTGGTKATRFDLQSLRAGSKRWRTQRRATTKRAARITVKRGVRYRFRARGRSGDGLTGGWARSPRVKLPRR